MPFHNLTDEQVREAFWDASPIPMSLVDRNGRFSAVNPAWTGLLGYARSELEGKHFREITHPADIGGDEAEVARILGDPGAEGYSMVKRYLHKHGPSIWVELHVRAVRDAEQKLECFAVCLVPIPVAPQPLPAAPEPHLLRVTVLCFLDVLKKHPREFILASSLAIVAVGKVPLQPILDFLQRYILNP